MAAERVSKDYQYLLVPVDRPGYRTEEEAIKDASRGWGLQLPRYRGPCFVARIVAHLKPDYGIKVDKTEISETKKPKTAKKPNKRKARR